MQTKIVKIKKLLVYLLVEQYDYIKTLKYNSVISSNFLSAPVFVLASAITLANCGECFNPTSTNAGTTAVQ